jgi:hypothetical protein
VADPESDIPSDPTAIARKALGKIERDVHLPELKTQEESPKQDASGYDPNDLTRVPGVVGDLIDWTCSFSLYPNRRLALGTALVAVGTLIGHRVAGPTRAGTHLYVVMIAPTGSGKQSPMNGLKNAFQAIGAERLIGPGDFRSSVGLVNTLKERSLLACCIDEYGAVLQRIVHSSAGNYEMDLMNILQQVWGLSYAPYNSPAAAREKSVRIFAPALSIAGYSTAETFYGAVKDKQISGGLLNRHLIIEAQQEKIELHKPAPGSWKVPPALVASLKSLHRPQTGQTGWKELLAKTPKEITEALAASFDPQITMGWGPGAEAIFDHLARTVHDEPDQLRRNLFIRVAELTVRVATIAAFGRASHTVDRPDMEWAHKLVLGSAETLHAGVKKYTVDPQDFAGLCRRILDLLVEYGGRITKREIKRRCTNYINRGTDLDGALKHLAEAELIREHIETNGGRSSIIYEKCE